MYAYVEIHLVRRLVFDNYQYCPVSLKINIYNYHIKHDNYIQAECLEIIQQCGKSGIESSSIKVSNQIELENYQ